MVDVSRRELLAGVAALASVPSDTSHDLELVAQRIVASLLPRHAVADPAADETARRWASSLGPQGTWSDIDYQDAARSNWITAQHHSRVRQMAIAWAAAPPGSRMDPGPIHRALGWWFTHDPQNPNWWHNQIGVPTSIGETLLVLGGEVARAEIEEGIRILKRATWQKWTGQNLVWGVAIQVMRGCLGQDRDAVAQGFGRMVEEVRIAPLGGEGIQADFSFHQHGPLLYNGGYGLGFSHDCARFAYYAAGTRYAFPRATLAILSGYFLEGQQWMTWGRLFDYSAVGREITRPGKSAGGLAEAARQLAGAGAPRRAELLRMADRLEGGPKARPLVGNRAFWRSDYLCHRRPGWLFTVRMHSDRTLNTDGFINGENRRSHCLADGVTLLYRGGNEYTDLFPAWDWRRLPGITAAQSDAESDPRRVSFRGGSAVAGSVSDGRCGLAAMQLDREVRAARAWFCFEDCVVSLGAGISGGGPGGVLTSVEQQRASPGGARAANGRPLGPTPEDPGQWAEHDGVVYWFGPGQAVRGRVAEQSGDWRLIGVADAGVVRDQVFSLWIDHGVAPGAAACEYVVIPGGRPPRTGSALAPPARAIANTSAVQAAWHPRGMLIMASFRAAGELAFAAGRVQVDQPCLLMLRLGAGAPLLHVAAIDNRPGVVRVQVTTDGRDASATVALPAGLDGGRTVRVEVA